MEAPGATPTGTPNMFRDTEVAPALPDAGRNETSIPRRSAEDEWRSQRTVDLIGQMRGGSLSERERQDCLDQVVQLNLPIAESLARRYRSHGEDLEDLIQVARLGLLQAIKRFRPEAGEFVSFAVPTISGEIKRHFRDHFWSVPRPPRRVQDLRREVSAAWSRVAQEQGHIPTAAEIADWLGVDREEVREAAATSPFKYAPLDSSEDAGVGVSDRVGAPDPGIVGIEDALQHAALMKRLRPAIAELSEEDQLILRMRFAEGYTQSVIAAEFGVSQMSISRRLTKIIDRLRQALEGTQGDCTETEAPSSKTPPPVERTSSRPRPEVSGPIPLHAVDARHGGTRRSKITG